MRIHSIRLENLMRPDEMTQEKAFLCGQEVTFGVPDSAKLKKRVADHYKRGQELLKDFKRWLVRHEGMTDEASCVIAARVWDAMVFTWDQEEKRSKPWELLDNDQYSWGYRLYIRASLRRWATFAKDAELLQEVLAKMRNPKKSLVRIPPKPGIKPLSQDTIEEMLQAIDGLSGDPRIPWAYSILRMVVLGGLNLTTLVWIDRHRIERAKATGILEIWSKRSRKQVLPISLFEPELQLLLDFPVRWKTLADLIAPSGRPSQRNSRARRKIKNVMKEVYTHIGIPMPQHWTYQLRLTAAKRYYGETNNIVAASQIIGLKDPSKLLQKFFD